MVYPRRITTDAELASVEAALERFYFSRPTVYQQDMIHDGGYEAHGRLLRQHATAGTRILEFGCGGPVLPLAVHRHGFSVIGCDLFSTTDLAEFRAGLPSGVELLSCDGRTIPLPSGSVGVVSSRNVFEHITRVAATLRELDRVLMPGGLFVLSGPNWSGPNNPVRALLRFARGRDRHWQYGSIRDALTGISRSLGWYVEARFAREPPFILVVPRMLNGEIHYTDGDDDAVHLCQPVSFARWFKAEGYRCIRYNRWGGQGLSKYWNSLFPSFATINTLIFRKPDEACPRPV